jgi:hypothetical protein
MSYKFLLFTCRLLQSVAKVHIFIDKNKFSLTKLYFLLVNCYILHEFIMFLPKVPLFSHLHLHGGTLPHIP